MLLLVKFNLSSLHGVNEDSGQTEHILWLKWFSADCKAQTIGFVRKTHTLIEPRREKTGFLHMRKQRRRSASR